MIECKLRHQSAPHGDLRSHGDPRHTLLPPALLQSPGPSLCHQLTQDGGPVRTSPFEAQLAPAAGCSRRHQVLPSRAAPRALRCLSGGHGTDLSSLSRRGRASESHKRPHPHAQAAAAHAHPPGPTALRTQQTVSHEKRFCDFCDIHVQRLGGHCIYRWRPARGQLSLRPARTCLHASAAAQATPLRPAAGLGSTICTGRPSAGHHVPAAPGAGSPVLASQTLPHI